MALQFQEAIPLLGFFIVEEVKEFYGEFLGSAVDREHPALAGPSGLAIESTLSDAISLDSGHLAALLGACLGACGIPPR